MPLYMANQVSDQVRAAVIDVVRAVRDDGLVPGDDCPELVMPTLIGCLEHACRCPECQALTVLWTVMVVMDEFFRPRTLTITGEWPDD